MRCSIKQMVIKMKKLIGLLVLILASHQIVQAQSATSCDEGEVGVVVSLSFTQVVPVGEVTWDIQDADGNIYGTNPFTYAANFVYTSDEVCVPEGGTYTFNANDAGGDGWGSGSWYEVGMCGGNTTMINNNGNAPSGDGVSEDFSVPVVMDDCFCFSADLVQSSASTTTASDGSVTTNIYAGNPPFTFNWSNGATTQNLSNVAPGVYVLTVTDSLDCEFTQMVEVQGPNIYMGPGDIELCTGYFYDSGGANGNFDAGENYVLTICSDDPDLSTAINFYSFDLAGTPWASPTLTIYDGASTFDPVLYSYTGPGDDAPGNIAATEDNITGCLTVHFTSPWSVEAPGWFAEINCQYPCQDFTVEIESSDWINALGQIDACYDIDLNVLTDYPENDEYYTQADNTTTFQWMFGDGQIASGQSVNHLYAEEGEYELSLFATDINGCNASTSLTVINDEPGIITTIFPPEDTEICPETIIQATAYAPGDTATSFFDPIYWFLFEDVWNGGEEFGEAIYLPDGSGVSYTTEINVTAFDPLAILDDDDFIEVCVEIEHSYLGDLDMSLTAPNGTEVMLFEQVGGATWLGDALDMDATETPGACWEYCWSIDADFGTFANSLTNTMIAPLGGNSMIPGSYEPLGDFSDYEGSPANGTWVLTITDNLAIDNGFICGWGLSMNVVGEEDEIIADTLVAEILTYNWYCAEEPSSIVDYDSTMVIVQPTTAGIHTYVMTITDTYGCEYTEEFEVDVYSSPVAAPNGVSECQENFDLAVTNVPPGGGSWQWVDGPDNSSVSFDPDTNSFTPEITVSEIGEYTFVFTDLDCGLSDEMTVDFEVVNPIINPVLDVTCLLDNTISVIDPTGNGGEWTVVAPDTSMLATLVDSSLLQTGISVNEFGTYQIAFTVDFCFGIDSMDVNFITVDPYIFNPGVQVCDWAVDIEVENPSPTGGLWEMISQPNHTTAEMSALNQDFLDIEVDDFGAYEMVYTIAGCETSDTLAVQFGQAIPQLSFEELMRCDLSTDMEVETHGMEEGWIFIDGPDTAIFTNPFAIETNLIATQYGDYTFGYTGCDTTMVFNILFMCDLTIPNVFSPNGDNLNDYLTVEGLTDEFYSYSNMSVYNRWGDEVYRNGHYGLDNSWWDGQSTHQNEELSDGVYFYILKVGNKVTDEEDVYRGTIHLLN